MTKPPKYKLFQSAFWWINLLMAAIFLISGFAGQNAPSLHPLLSVLGLIYPLLLSVQIVFLFGWMLSMNIRFLLPLLVLMVSYPNLKENIAFHCFAKKAVPDDIHLLTYNVQGFSNGNYRVMIPALKAKVIDFVEKQHPDIICMQEFKPSHETPEVLKQIFKKGSYYFKDYSGNESWKNDGLVIDSRFPSVGHNFLKLNKGRTFAIYSDLIVQRDTLRLINVHLASIGLSSIDLYLISAPSLEHPKSKNPWTHWRMIYHKLTTAFELHEKQIHRVRQCIAQSPYPVILCGDFNDTPSSYAYHQTTGLLHDTFLDKGCLFGATYAGPLPFLRIDHVFIPKQMKTVWYRRLKVHLSDHFALSVGLNFRNSTK